MEQEVWKDIPGYEGRYQISNFGRVWSSHHSRMVTPKKVGRGYRAVTLCKEGDKHRFYIHRLVALCFLPQQTGACCEVNHKDLDKTNNRASNLEWVTQKENYEHAYKLGCFDFRRSLRSDNKTGVAGVTQHGGGYQATISYNQKRHYLGWYKGKDEAVTARKNAERRLLIRENT